MDALITARWRGRLVTRRALLARARKALAKAERGLAWARKNKRQSVRSREREVAELRELVTYRTAQVAAARRVLARHAHPTRTSEKGVRFIMEFEGFPNGGRPYRDPVGVWTIGYGHIEGVGPDTPRLTRAQAEKLLRHDLATRYEPPLERAVPVELRDRQGEYDALASFVFNLGVGAVASAPGFETLQRAIAKRNPQSVADAFLLYDKAGGRVLPGLARRRKAERQLYLTGSYATD